MDLVTFTEEIRNGKRYFLCSAYIITRMQNEATGKLLQQKNISDCSKVPVNDWKKLLNNNSLAVEQKRYTLQN